MLFSINSVKAQWDLNGNAISSSNFLGTTNAQALNFKINNSGVMQLSLKGNLLMGTATDVYKLTIFGKTGKTYTQWANIATLDGINNGFLIGLDAGSLEAQIKQQEDAPMLFYTNNTERLRISKEGYIGIGTNSPNKTFHLVGDFKFIDGNQSLNKVLTSDANGVGTWQELTLSLNSNLLTINGFSAVDLSAYIDNTDEQTLSLLGENITISNGNTVNLSSLNYWTKTSTNNLYYNEGNIGIGLNNPNSLLQLYSEIDQGGSIGVGGPKGLPGGGSSSPSYYKSTILLTNLQTGKTENDGLKLESNNKNGILRLQEAGELSLTVGNYGIRIKQDGNLKFDKLAGTGDRVLLADAQGNISTIETNSFADNLGDHTATQNLNMNSFNILHNDNTDAFTIMQNTNSANGPGIEMYGEMHNTVNRRGDMIFITNGTEGDFGFTNYDSGWHRKMTIKANGNIGIGTSNPKANLHIEQNEETTFILGDYNSTNKSAIKMWGNTGEYAFIQAGSESNNGKLKICRYNSTWKNLDDFQIHSNIVYIDGKVGIKNDNPQYSLDVDGEIRASSLEGTDDRLLIADEQGRISANMSIDNLNIWHKINDDIYFNNGKVSIGTTNPNDEAVLTLFGEIDERNKLIDFQQGYGIFSDNAGSGYGGSTRLWFDAPNNGTIVFGPRVGAAMLHNIRIRAYYSNFEGYIWAKEVKVRNSSPYADYVFKPDYNLPTLEETEKYIKKHKHLKEIPTEKQVKENNGIELGKMNVLLLKKVEELTLYVIQLNNKLKEQQKQIDELNKIKNDEK